MANYITIDGGTTNTRISIVKDLKVVDTLKFNVGARMGIEDKKLLKETVKQGIYNILSKNNMCESQIDRILASGMITSEFGLHELKHIETPAGIKELHNAMEEVRLCDISSIPFVFMRGVKTNGKSFENTDMMRGEETELMGIKDADEGNCVYILPGSHSKIIHTDKDGRICEFSTMLTGEMAGALSQHTILKDAISFEYTDINKELLLKGFDYCSKDGINKALFKIRILKNIFGYQGQDIYSFFMGVILCDEIQYILKTNPEKIVIGGKKQFKEAICMILEEKSKKSVQCISDDEVDISSVVGMIRIYESK